MSHLNHYNYGQIAQRPEYWFNQFLRELPLVLRVRADLLVTQCGHRAMSEYLEPTGKSLPCQLSELLTTDSFEAARLCIQAALKGERGELVLTFNTQSTKGEAAAKSAKCQVFADAASGEVFLVGLDISELVTWGKEQAQKASADALTGLPNKATLHARLQWQLDQSRRHQTGFGLAVIDLNGFKQVNDERGHLAGDFLLKEVAARIKGCLREVDFVCRIGGDEFLLILPDVATPADAHQVGARILSKIAEPIRIESETVEVGASLGVALFPEHGLCSEDLIHKADVAMYAGKRQGRVACTVYEKKDTTALNNLPCDKSLQEALAQDEFYVEYQPILTWDKKLKAVELFLRWRREDGSQVPPSQFLTLAERSGLIHVLGDFVLRRAVALLSAFRQAGLSHLQVHINVSSRQLRQTSFPSTVAVLCEMAHVSSERLTLEIPDELLANEPQKVLPILSRVKQTGVQLVVDDYGTGPSCLAQLSRYPLDGLKIDKNFIKGLGDSPETQSTINAIIAIARSFRLTVIAEGVESSLQVEFLKEKGVPLFQGYHYCAPLSAADLMKLAKSDRRAHRPALAF